MSCLILHNYQRFGVSSIVTFVKHITSAQLTFHLNILSTTFCVLFCSLTMVIQRSQLYLLVCLMLQLHFRLYFSSIYNTLLLYCTLIHLNQPCYHLSAARRIQLRRWNQWRSSMMPIRSHSSRMSCWSRGGGKCYGHQRSWWLS
jgi:hypothetical protein